MADTALGSAGTGQGDTPPAAENPSGGASGAGAGESKSWRDSLPEDMRSNPAIATFTDVASLTKSYIHAQSTIGKKGVIVPGEKASDADWAAFYQGIGVPPADKYDVAIPKDFTPDEKVIGEFKQIAPKLGLLPKQASGLLEWFAKNEAEGAKAEKLAKDAQTQEGLNGLKKEWGEGYQKELKSAHFAAKEIGGEEFLNYLDKSGYGNDPHLIRYFAKASKLFAEDKLREGGVSDGRMTHADIDASIADLRSNAAQNGFYDKTHPGHMATLAKFESLMKQKTGGK